MLKRLFDISCSFLGLVFLAPILSLIIIWIKYDSPGPIFFRQVRVGRFDRPFKIHKFRSMRLNSENAGRLTIGADNRITRSGSFLRKYKLDELPQLIDVLIGNMSLVGPRPEVQEFIDCYPSKLREKILSVRPGITDRASIEMVDENEILGKSNDPHQLYINEILPLKQKYYLEYVENQSLINDIKIILTTLKKIISR